MNQTTPPPFDGYKPHQAPPAPPYRQRKFSDTVSFKILFLVILTLVLLIPDTIIYGTISERENRQNETMREISEQWSSQQTIIGPMLTIPYHMVVNGRDTLGTVTVLPSALNYDAALKSQTLRRGIYEDVVYNSEVQLAGSFDLSTMRPTEVPLSALMPDRARVTIGVTDLRGIEKVSDFDIAGHRWELSGSHALNNGVIEITVDGDESGCGASLSAKADLDSLIGIRELPYRLTMSLRGSHAMSVAPVGKTNEIKIAGDSKSPSFKGMFLPSDRNVADGGFDAVWNLNAINRDYPQVFEGDDMAAIEASAVTVDLLVPVDRYQKTERAVKYAVLVILLTFIGVLFAEMMTKRKIYVFQYLLVGLALILFYSLLLSLSEHMAFGISYLVSAVMTVGLVGVYMAGVLGSARTAAYIGGLLSVIYAYIFILLNLETYALLAGSIGLFVALAAVMYVSLKMDWKSL